MNQTVYRVAIKSPTPVTVVDVLAQRSGLSKIKIKDAMQKGAVWVKTAKHPAARLRRATSEVRNGGTVELYYDETILNKTVPAAQLIWQCADYSVWYKPAGMLSQGTNYGDHLALLRYAERNLPKLKTAYLVHRLDREADGLMLIAHHRKAASALSALFVVQKIEKRYRVVIKGHIKEKQGQINMPLDDKPALTLYQVMQYDEPSDTTTLQVSIKTGRTHQIRRHFDAIGHPVMGDPKYGEGNKNSQGMQLTADYLSFHCPMTRAMQQFELPLTGSASTAL